MHIYVIRTLQLCAVCSYVTRAAERIAGCVPGVRRARGPVPVPGSGHPIRRPGLGARLGAGLVGAHPERCASVNRTKQA